MIAIILKHPSRGLQVTMAAVVLLAAAACGQRPGDPGNALAVVNGKPISVSEFDLRWSQLPDYARKKYSGPDGRKQFLEELVDREVLLQEAKRRGTDQDRALLERVERFKERSILDLLRRDEVDARVTVSPDEVKAYYDAHAESFTSPDEFRASHILLKSESEARELKKELESGKAFADLAKTRSLDVNTKSRGGDLGVLKRGQTVPEFEKALMTLKPGEISDPVATQFGYHLIKLSRRTKGHPLSYEDAKDQAREQLLMEKKQKRFKELVAALRAKAQVRVSEDRIPDPGSGSAATTNSAAHDQ